MSGFLEIANGDNLTIEKGGYMLIRAGIMLLIFATTAFGQSTPLQQVDKPTVIDAVGKRVGNVSAFDTMSGEAFVIFKLKTQLIAFRFSGNTLSSSEDFPLLYSSSDCQGEPLINALGFYPYEPQPLLPLTIVGSDGAVWVQNTSTPPIEKAIWSYAVPRGEYSCFSESGYTTATFPAVNLLNWHDYFTAPFKLE